MAYQVVSEYKRIKQLFEDSPKKDEIINFWEERNVDIGAYIDFQFLNQKNILPESILKPTEDEIIKINLNEIFNTESLLLCNF